MGRTRKGATAMLDLTEATLAEISDEIFRRFKPDADGCTLVAEGLRKLMAWERTPNYIAEKEEAARLKAFDETARLMAGTNREKDEATKWREKA
jgi:hypothetical protein